MYRTTGRGMRSGSAWSRPGPRVAGRRWTRPRTWPPRLAVEALCLEQNRGGEGEPGPGRPPGSGPTADRFGGPGDGGDQPDRERSGGQPYAVRAEVVGECKEGDQPRWPVDPLRPVQVAPAGAGVPGHHRKTALVGAELSGQREQVHAQGRGASQRNRVPQQPTTRCRPCRSRPVGSGGCRVRRELRSGRTGAGTCRRRSDCTLTITDATEAT